MGQMSIAENALLLVDTFAIERSINNGPRAPAGQGGVPTMTGGTALTCGLSPPQPVPVAREGHGISERRDVQSSVSTAVRCATPIGAAMMQ
jgi:hypothetical protein